MSFEVALFPSDKYVKNRVFLSFWYPRQQNFVQAISEKLRFKAEKRQINSATSKLALRVSFEIASMESHSLWCQMALGWGVSDEDDIDA